jgi:hypothetical protein
MNKKELVEIIRTVVREEINNSLPQYLMEVLAERITAQPVITEQKEPSQASAQRNKPLVTFEAPIKKSPVQAPRTFSSNPIFNQILNETVGGIPDESSVSVPSAIDTIKNMPKEVLAENKDIAAVANAMTRDYSKLMRAIDAKAKSGRPA